MTSIGISVAISSAISANARAETQLLFESEREVPVAELLDLLDILPGVSTDAKVSASAGPFGASADLSGDGRLTCRAEGDDVVLAAGDGPALGTCFTRVCTTTLGLLEICGTHALEVRSTACFTSGPGVIDPGCAPDAPICTGGDDARCVGCLEDLDCGVPSGTFGLGLGEVAHVTVGLLTELLGLDLGIPLSTIQVSADVNGPFSDRAILQNGVTCALTADGSVDLTAEAEASGASTLRRVCRQQRRRCRRRL